MHAEAVVAEWLRRWTRNPLGSARTGSNPVDCVTIFSVCLRVCVLAATGIQHKKQCTEYTRQYILEETTSIMYDLEMELTSITASVYSQKPGDK